MAEFFLLLLLLLLPLLPATNGRDTPQRHQGKQEHGSPPAGVPRLLGSTATGGSVQAALWNAVCKHVWKVGIVSMRGVKCVLKLC